jgi:hypothetical protein
MLDVKGLKHRWLFNLRTDPTEQHDLQFDYPEKVDELLARIRQLQVEKRKKTRHIEALPVFASFV